MKRKYFWRRNLVLSDELTARMAGNKDLTACPHPDDDTLPFALLPNLVASLADDGFHYPALDIDVPMRVVASSTPGHHHLYFDETKLTWEQYEVLLEALAKAGIIGSGYLTYSKVRKMTLLRPEGVKKEIPLAAKTLADGTTLADILNIPRTIGKPMFGGFLGSKALGITGSVKEITDADTVLSLAGLLKQRSHADDLMEGLQASFALHKLDREANRAINGLPDNPPLDTSNPLKFSEPPAEWTFARAKADSETEPSDFAAEAPIGGAV